MVGETSNCNQNDWKRRTTKLGIYVCATNRDIKNLFKIILSCLK